jgi:hypothetical protein
MDNNKKTERYCELRKKLFDLLLRKKFFKDDEQMKQKLEEEIRKIKSELGCELLEYYNQKNTKRR